MDYEIEKEVVINEKNLYIIDKINVDGKDYIYTQTVLDDDLAEEYYVYELNDSPTLLTDADKLEKVLKLFVDDINNKIDMGD